RDQAARSLAWRLPHSLGAFKNDRLRSVSIMFPFDAYIGGRRVTMGGLSGVATAPESRRGGLVAKGLARWFEDLHERGIGWSAEHPFEPTFYAKLGYQTVLNGHTVEVDLQQLRSSARPPAAIGDAVPVDPGSITGMQEIYARFAPRFSFMLARDDGVKDHWGLTSNRPWEPSPHFGHELEDAYVVATTERDLPNRPLLRVRDVAYASPAGRDRLFSFLASFDGQVDGVRLHLPPGDQVALDRAAYATAESPELQVRIVDLAVVVEQLHWPDEAQLTLRLRDEQCPWNDGTFSIEVGPQGAAVKPVANDTPDAATDIGSLAALLS